MIDLPDQHQRRTHPNRRVIGATCTTCNVARGFTNLALIKRDDGHIELDPHCTGCCVIRLDKPGARVLIETMTEWLR